MDQGAATKYTIRSVFNLVLLELAEFVVVDWPLILAPLQRVAEHVKEPQVIGLQSPTRQHRAIP